VARDVKLTADPYSTPVLHTPSRRDAQLITVRNNFSFTFTPALNVMSLNL
jgi:hypothetical protein